MAKVMDLPLRRVAIPNAAASFARMSELKTLEEIYQAEVPSINLPKSREERTQLGNQLLGRILHERMSPTDAAECAIALAFMHLFQGNLAESLKNFGKLYEAIIADFGLGWLTMFFPAMFSVIGYIMDNIEHYPPAKDSAGYLRWFLDKTIEFLEEHGKNVASYRDRLHPPFASLARPDEEEELLILAYGSLGCLLEGNCQMALSSAEAFDQATDSAFHLTDWVKKRATKSYVHRFL